MLKTYIMECCAPSFPEGLLFQHFFATAKLLFTQHKRHKTTNNQAPFIISNSHKTNQQNRTEQNRTEQPNIFTIQLLQNKTNKQTVVHTIILPPYSRSKIVSPLLDYNVVRYHKIKRTIRSGRLPYNVRVRRKPR